MENRWICLGVIALTLGFGCLPFRSTAQREEYIKVRLGAEIRTFEPGREPIINAPSIPSLTPYLSAGYSAFPVISLGKCMQRKHDFEYGCSMSYAKEKLLSQIQSYVIYSPGYWRMGDAIQKVFRASVYAESWRERSVAWRRFGFGSELFTGTTRFDGNFHNGPGDPLQIRALWHYVALDYRLMGELRFGQEKHIGLMAYLGWHFGWQRLLNAKLSAETIPELDRQSFTFTGVNMGAVVTYAWPQRK